MVFTTEDNGVAFGAYAPLHAKVSDDVSVEIMTDYPFDDKITISVSSKNKIPVYLRVPCWAEDATINGQKVTACTLAKYETNSNLTNYEIDLNPKIKLEQWFETSYSVLRGPLMYSLPV